MAESFNSLSLTIILYNCRLRNTQIVYSLDTTHRNKNVLPKRTVNAIYILTDEKRQETRYFILRLIPNITLIQRFNSPLSIVPGQHPPFSHTTVHNLGSAEHRSEKVAKPALEY